MDFLRIMSIIGIVSIMIVLIRNYKSDYAVLLELSAVVAVGFAVISGVNLLSEALQELNSFSSNAIMFLKILLKALCISIMTDIASSFCNDCSNTTLSKCVDLIGKIAILSLSFPLLNEFIESIITFLK